MPTVVGGTETLAASGRDAIGVVFLALALASLALGFALRRTSWSLAAVAIPGAAAGFVGAVVWETNDLSFRWLLVVAPVAAVLIFAARREGTLQAAVAAVTSGVVAVAFFLLGSGVMFLYGYH